MSFNIELLSVGFEYFMNINMPYSFNVKLEGADKTLILKMLLLRNKRRKLGKRINVRQLLMLWFLCRSERSACWCWSTVVPVRQQGSDPNADKRSRSSIYLWAGDLKQTRRGSKEANKSNTRQLVVRFRSRSRFRFRWLESDGMRRWWRPWWSGRTWMEKKRLMF